MRRREQRQHLFLEQAAVLGLVFEDVGPLGLQTGQEIVVGFEGLQGKHDQIVEVHCAA